MHIFQKIIPQSFKLGQSQWAAFIKKKSFTVNFLYGQQQVYFNADFGTRGVLNKYLHVTYIYLEKSEIIAN